MATRRSRRFSRGDHADAANLNLQKLRQRQLPERAQAIVINRTAGGAAVEELLDSFIASHLCGIEHGPCSFLRLISIATRAAHVFIKYLWGSGSFFALRTALRRNRFSKLRVPYGCT